MLKEKKKKSSPSSTHTGAQIAVVVSSITAVITAIRCELVHLASRRTCSDKMCEYIGNIFRLEVVTVLRDKIYAGVPNSIKPILNFLTSHLTILNLWSLYLHTSAQFKFFH